MGLVMRWTGPSNDHPTVNRCQPFDQWINLSNGTVTLRADITGPDQIPVYELVSTNAANNLGKRDRGTSNTSADGPMSDATVVHTAWCWVRGYRGTVGKTIILDLGDLNGSSTQLTDDWQLLVSSGTTDSHASYTFLDLQVQGSLVDVGDKVLVTQPQCETRPWATRFVDPAGNTATSRAASRPSHVGDDSGQGNLGVFDTVPSKVRVLPDAPGGYAFQFFGSDSTPSPLVGPQMTDLHDGQSDITLCAWFKKDDTAPISAWHNLVGAYYTDLQLAVHDSGYIGVGVVSGEVRTFKTAGSGAADGEWHHVALTWSYSTSTLTGFIDGVRVGQWNTTPGVLSRTGAFNVGVLAGSSYPTFGQIADIRLYTHLLTPEQVFDVARVGGRVTNGKEFQAGELVEGAGSYTPSLIDYSTWVVGTTGSQPGFARNGYADENLIVVGVNPWGRDDILWRGEDNGTVSSSGGWNGDQFPIDNTKRYRFTCWIRRTVTDGTTTAGRAYLGTRGYNSTGGNIGVLHASNGVVTTNPYFISGQYLISRVGDDEWLLHVGTMWPVGSGTPGLGADDGTWQVDGTNRYNGTSAYVWQPDNAKALHRAYLFYGNPTWVQHFYRPRVDIVDGTEPPLHDLLRGHENPNLYGASNDPRINSVLQARMPSFTEGGATVRLAAGSMGATTFRERVG